MVTHPIFNRFQVLKKPIEDEFQTRLVGDSLVRVQLEEFLGHSSDGCTKLYCIPEAKANDITAPFEDVTKNAGPDTHHIVLKGTNNILEIKSEELV